MKLQFKLSFAIMLFILTMLVGCSKKTEMEAVKQAKEYLKLTQIDGSYYLCEITANTKTVYELRKIEIKVSPHSLNEADKLNGLEWKGAVYLNSGAFRRYSPRPYSGEPDKTWSDWVSEKEQPIRGLERVARYADILDVQKIKGKWEVQSLSLASVMLLGPITYKQVEMSDLPK